GVARQVRTWLRRDAARFPALGALAEALPAAAEVEAALACTLDERGQVRDDASPALTAARAVVRELRVELEARLLRLVRDPDMADTVAENYVTVRNGRFVVPIRIAAAGTVAGVVQDRSGSGETVFIEPLFAVQLNNRLLLAAKDEEAEERRVRAEVTALVREHGPQDGREDGGPQAPRPLRPDGAGGTLRAGRRRQPPAVLRYGAGRPRRRAVDRTGPLDLLGPRREPGRDRAAHGAGRARPA